MSQTIRRVLSFLVLSLLFSPLRAQENEAYFERLFYLCKTWGHVKYFHSEVARGSVDWDQALITAIQSIKSASTETGFNNALRTMLTTAGEPEIRDTNLPEVIDSLNNNRDLSWMNAAVFAEDIRSQLQTITERFRPQPNVYISRNGQFPDFEVDDEFFGSGENLDEARRLVALFRYWNIIHYFFPYKNIMDQPWDDTLMEFIPKVATSQGLDYHLALRELTTYINDSHAFSNSSSIWNWIGTSHAPFLVRYIEGETVITKVLNTVSNVAIGDVIEAIDGQEIEVLRAYHRTYTAGSNEASRNRDINLWLGYGESGNFQVRLRNADGVRTETLSRNSTNRQQLLQSNGPSWQNFRSANGCDLGVVDMGELEQFEVSRMFTELGDTDAIIFDIRNYPNGTLWTMVDYLFEDGITVANFTSPDLSYPGRFVWQVGEIGQGGTTYQGEIVILFDERTQSQAEYTVMGLEQFPGATKIGSTTAAADGNIGWIRLPGGFRTAATFLGVFYPDYTPTQRVGIIPDIEVKPTLESIRSRRDDVMQAAYNFLGCDIITSTNETTVDEVNLYPNPSRQTLNYIIPDSALARFEFRIFDAKGVEIQAFDTGEHQGSIDISTLSEGIYHLIISTGSSVIRKRFVKN